jgi:carbamoyltransferase
LDSSSTINSLRQIPGMYIIGISSLAHDPAAVLVGEEGIIAAIEEGKLLRTREPDGIPRRAIDFCLAKGRVQWKDVDTVAIAGDPLRGWGRQAIFRAREMIKAPISSSYYQMRAVGRLARELNNLRIVGVLAGTAKRPLLRFEHALCHAASAFYASPFDHALILTLDEQGDGLCGLLAEGSGSQIRQLRSIRFPDSLAWVYSQVTELLGFRQHLEEHKTQWLSTTGKPVFCDLFLQIFRHGKNLWPRVNPRFFRRGFAGNVAFSDEFYRHLGISGGDGLRDDQARANLASSLQQACSIVVVDLLESLRRRYQTKFLCLAGGLFLNPLIVAAAETEAGFQQTFVQPAAGNAGTALGAAWLAQHQRERKPRSAPLARLDWGPSYSNEEIKQVLDNCKASYHWTNTEDQKIEEALRLLRAGKIVAWFQGASEFGPRALGNRSLLASPWNAYVKDNLNDFVKHRESFRPFALSVPEPDCARYFECSQAGHFMATVGFARPESREILKQFLLPGDCVRLHIVGPAANPLLWKLLKRFGEDSPAPILVNTSFNLFGEPLVVTPRQAVRSYFCSGADALIIGNFVLSKTAVPVGNRN